MPVFKVSFDEPVQITEEAELRRIFGSDRLYLGPGSRVNFDGEITLAPDVALYGENHVKGPARVDNGAVLTNVTLGRDNVVRAYSVMLDLQAGDGNLFGPFCFVRDNCVVADHCIIGSHVEATRSRFASGVKVSHRAFIGDAEVGADTIIGAGVVFCNFDGSRRQPTTVGANVTVGSGCLLIPPVVLGDGSLIAAGSTVTKDIAPGAKVIQKR
jgi:bifunctional UDP-N-acetylglucosamine pyrophosphorylase/glucosamine-1-phosphate N-acetyltransferase